MFAKKQLVILIIAGALILLIGVGLGIIYQMNPSQQKIRTEASSILSTKVISSISAYGKVIKIEGKNITLSNLGDSLAVSITDSARIYSFINSAQQAAEFEDIKVGDNVNAVLKLLPNSQYEGSSIIILPPSVQ